MAPLLLEGETLGIKHQNYNKLLHQAIASNTKPDTDLTGNNDIQNLLKIDIACKNKDVDYVLEVYKSEDMLYVSRAIKRSNWLITDEKYAHIINPDYLHKTLFPHMTTKAINKLLLSIRLNLKNETRIEQFYYDIVETNKQNAFKWLQYCSVPVIEKEVHKFSYDIPSSTMIRLFRRSLSIFEITVQSNNYNKYELMDNSQFLAKVDPEKYLDIIDSKPLLSVNFTASTTEYLMKKCPHRILDKFEVYYDRVHAQTFAQYFVKEGAKDFLIKQLKNEKVNAFFTFGNIEHFMNLLPKENRFDIIKKLFIDKEPVESIKDQLPSNEITIIYLEKYKEFSNSRNIFKWYRYAPFEVAFTELRKLLQKETTPQQRMAILQVMLESARKNMTNIRTVLKYYYDKHINEPFKFKIEFINNFICQTDPHTFDDETWNLLNQFFRSLELYTERTNNLQACVITLIVRHVIKGEEIPDIVQKKFICSSLRNYEAKLKNDNERELLFTYLFNNLKAKIDFTDIRKQSEFENTLYWCEKLFKLLKDWKKDLGQYPFAISCVKELYKLKKANSFDTDLSTLYNIKKSWRKFMFEESIIFSPSGDVCINALKHDPDLLIRHKDEIKQLCKTDATEITQLLKKVRVYWPDSLANELKQIYLDGVQISNSHKALVSGICTLLPQNEFKEFAEKYVPNETKIDWEDIDEAKLSIRKQIAKNMHKARPLVSIDIVLLYAKGDYLQFAVPSLDSVLSQMSLTKINPRIPQLLKAPVSLQKFGIRYAFQKLNSLETKDLFSNIWLSNKNASIKIILFQKTHALLCREKNDSNIKVLWELFSMFIDNLSHDENKCVYTTLAQCQSIPMSIRTQYFMKSFKFLKSLPPKANCENLVDDMKCRTNEIMMTLDSDFVINVMLHKFDEHFTERRMNWSDSDCIVKYLLLNKDENIQFQRYNDLVKPMLVRYLPFFYKFHENEYYTKTNIEELLNKLIYELRNTTIKEKLCVPVKVVKDIKNQLEKNLSMPKSYVFLTSWKLATEFVKLVDENKDIFMNYKFTNIDPGIDLSELCEKMHKNIAPKFAKSCVKILMEDVANLSPSIYNLFSAALIIFFNDCLMRDFMPTLTFQMYCKQILESGNEKEVHLMMYPLVADLIRKRDAADNDDDLKIIQKIFFSHPSEQLKFHYYDLFKEDPKE